MKRLLLLILVCTAPGAVAAADQRVLMVLGDSISAGYGLRIEEGWVSLLQERLHAQGYPYQVVNASVSGDTSSTALGRLPALIDAHHPALTVVELGGNDGLRGISPEEMHANLERIIALLQQAGSRVLLLPMELPPNYGPAYIDRFRAVYERLAHETGVTLGRFLLDGIAVHPDLMQDDGIHPRALAQPKMLELVWPALSTLLAPPPGAHP